MHDDRQSINLVAVEQNINLHHVGGTILLELIVHRRVTTRHRFELVKEIHNNLSQRHLVGEHHLATVVCHVHLHTPLLIGQCHHAADILLWHVQTDGDDRFAHFIEPPLIGHLGRVFNHFHCAVDLHHLVLHARRGGDQVLIKLGLQTLLHDLHVQQTEETAAKTKTQGL